MGDDTPPQNSVILPIYNAEAWLIDCLQSIEDQDFSGTIEVSSFNDGSTRDYGDGTAVPQRDYGDDGDNSGKILLSWEKKKKKGQIKCITNGHKNETPYGVGYAKNRAVEASSGKFLCFLDADDVMHPSRVSQEHEACARHHATLIGSRFHREPPGSTDRYTKWANGLTPSQLLTQVYTSHGSTVVMPTWMCSRNQFIAVGGFHEGGKGVPEDLIFFYKHLDLHGEVYRIDQDLLMYRYHPQNTTFSILEDTIWNLRIEYIQRKVINKWDSFTIWNAGKQGRKFYRSLTKTNQEKVKMFCDVDENKIKKGFYTYELSEEIPKPKIPVVHFSKAVTPLIICVKLDLTKGQFEENLASLNLKEGVDYFHFN